MKGGRVQASSAGVGGAVDPRAVELDSNVWTRYVIVRYVIPPGVILRGRGSWRSSYLRLNFGITFHTRL
jgi:hypothetical protein